MTYLLALLAAIVGCAVGAGLGMAVAGMLAAVLGISSFEGASGYFAVLIGGPIGEPGQTQTRRAGAADNYEIRYRADWPGEN
jgi:hypothetical protein